MSRIPLPSGLVFDFADPRPEMIDINDIALGLSKCCRFCGMCDGHYSVAHHSTLGAMQIEPRFALEFILHDATEYVCGDMVSPFKRLLPDYQRYEAIIDEAIRERFGLPWNMSPEVKAMDDAMYHTERRDLTPWADPMLSRFNIGNRAGQAIPGLVIHPMPWYDAREEFLGLFHSLTNRRYA